MARYFTVRSYTELLRGFLTQRNLEIINVGLKLSSILSLSTLQIWKFRETLLFAGVPREPYQSPRNHTKMNE